MAFFDVPRNEHQSGILRRSIVPCGLPHAVTAKAQSLTASVMETLEYVGVMTLEFFWDAERGLVANEIAPRVHNSGHWTPEATHTDQFEQHIRAIVDWPLGDPSRHCDAEMLNLIGEDADQWAALAEEKSASLTLYGKAEARPGRKMGHIVRRSPIVPWRSK